MARRKHTMGRPSRLPWVLLFVALASFAGVTYYGLAKYRLQATVIEDLNDKLASFKTDVGQAERDKLALETELGRAEVDIRDNRNRFSAYADEADDLRKKLAGIVGGDRSDVRVENERIILEIDDTALFQAGSARLSDDGNEALEKLGTLLIDMRERDVLIEGHTDKRPVSEVAKGFETNWEFSAARATAVLRYFTDQAGLEPERLSSIAYAEYRPISRTTRDKNSRIDIVLAPKSLQKIED